MPEKQTYRRSSPPSEFYQCPGLDITITTIIPYDFFGLAPLETLDYITICCPELLDRLALPIYCVLLGKETADGAISHIEREFLKT